MLSPQFNFELLIFSIYLSLFALFLYLSLSIFPSHTCIQTISLPIFVYESLSLPLYIFSISLLCLPNSSFLAPFLKLWVSKNMLLFSLSLSLSHTHTHSLSQFVCVFQIGLPIRLFVLVFWLGQGNIWINDFQMKIIIIWVRFQFLEWQPCNAFPAMIPIFCTWSVFVVVAVQVVADKHGQYNSITL